MSERAAVGVILAGGRGRRMGGGKAAVELAGRPLIHYPLEAMKRALQDVFVLAKADTELPPLPDTTVWIEPQRAHHPLVGILQALDIAGGRPVLVCAVDLPLVTAELLGRLADEDARGAPAVLARQRGQMQPLLGRYEPAAAALLRTGKPDPNAPLRERVAAIGPRAIEVEDPDQLLNVNVPEDLLRAAAIIDRRRATAPRRRAETR